VKGYLQKLEAKKQKLLNDQLKEFNDKVADLEKEIDSIKITKNSLLGPDDYNKYKKQLNIIL
jgi:hypothetical protein